MIDAAELEAGSAPTAGLVSPTPVPRVLDAFPGGG